MAALWPSKGNGTRNGGTVIASDEASQAGETRRSVDSTVDVQDASPPTPFNVEA